MTMSINDVVITCCQDECGISFAVPEWWHRGKKQTHAWFFCPNGHRQHFVEESAEEKLRRERDRALQQIARAEQEADAARKRAEQAERKTKKLEKRASAGTCPCCQRTFGNMAKHMKTKHPEFVADNVVKLKAAK